MWEALRIILSAYWMGAPLGRTMTAQAIKAGFKDHLTHPVIKGLSTPEAIATTHILMCLRILMRDNMDKRACLEGEEK